MTTHNHDVLMAINSRIINGRTGGATQLNADYRALVRARNEILSLRSKLEATQRTWVGLTEDERIHISYKANGNECVAVELTEAKLRSKNT